VRHPPRSSYAYGWIGVTLAFVPYLIDEIFFMVRSINLYGAWLLNPLYLTLWIVKIAPPWLLLSIAITITLIAGLERKQRWRTKVYLILINVLSSVPFFLVFTVTLLVMSTVLFFLVCSLPVPRCR